MAHVLLPASVHHVADEGSPQTEHHNRRDGQYEFVWK